jgi:hypothetical protein
VSVKLKIFENKTAKHTRIVQPSQLRKGRCRAQINVKMRPPTPVAQAADFPSLQPRGEGHSQTLLERCDTTYSRLEEGGERGTAMTYRTAKWAPCLARRREEVACHRGRW